MKGRARVSSIAFFVERSLILLPSERLVGYLINQALLSVDTYSHIRDYILNNATIEEVAPNLRIEDVIADLCILRIRPAAPNLNHMVIWRAQGDLGSEKMHVLQTDFFKNPGKAFLFLSNANFFDSVRSISVDLGACGKIARGMQITKEDFLFDTQETDNHHACVSNDNLDRYDLSWPSENQIDPDNGRKPYILFDKDVEEMVNLRFERNGSKTRVAIGKTPERFLSPKLFVRQSPPGAYLSATYDEQNFFSDYTVHVINKIDYDLKYLLALLNSKLLTHFALKWGILLVGENRTPQIMAKKMAQLPIRRIAFTTAAKRRGALVKEAQDLRGLSEAYPEGFSHANAPTYSDYLASPLGHWVAARLAAQPEEADCIHDLLAHFAAQMIALNQQKQSEMKRFLGWLEKAVGSGQKAVGSKKPSSNSPILESLVGKSKLRNYLGDYQKGEAPLSYAELEDILYKNRTKLGVSLNEPRFTSKLRTEYEQSVGKLLPIKAQLAATDRVIDWVVYQLYGLTVAEVAVVEGKD